MLKTLTLRKPNWLIGITVISLLALFGYVVAANAAGHTLSGTVTYEEYSSGSISIMGFDEEPGEGSTPIATTNIAAPGVYSLELPEGFSGDLYLFAFNDEDGDSNTDNDEGQSQMNINVNGDMEQNITLSIIDEGPGPGDEEGAELAFTGTILTPEDEPVEDVNLYVYNQDMTVQTGGNTNGSGEFNIYLVTQDAYSFEFFLPAGTSGYMPPDSITEQYSGVLVELGDIYLLESTKTITGIVRYEDNSPVTSASITAQRTDGGSRSEGEVGNNGTYELSVGPGKWEVFINAPRDEETGQEESVDWAYSGPPSMVNFKNNNTEEVETVNFKVEKASSRVSGRLVDENGDPVEGHIDLSKGHGPGSGGHTNQQGYFTISCNPGTYKLGVVADNSKYYLPEQKINVTDSHTANNPLDLGELTMGEKSAMIEGTITLENGDPVESLRLRAFMMDQPGWGNASTGGDGSYEMWLQPGTWKIELDTHGGDGGYVLVTAPEMFTLITNQTKSGVNFVVQETDATIEFSTVDKTGAAIAEAFGFVSCFEGDELGFGKGKDLGSQEFGGPLFNGSANISVLGGSSYTCMMHMPPDVGNYTVSGEVTVEVDENEETIAEFTLLENDSMIFGTMVDQNGDPVTGMRGEVFVLDENFNWSGTELGNDGAFELNVLGGKNYIMGQHFFDRGEYLESHPDESSRFYIEANTELRKDLIVPKAEAHINGVLLDPNGDPVSFAWVGAGNWHLFEGPNAGSQTEFDRPIESHSDTGENGRFSIPILAGEFMVFSGLPPWMQELNYMPPREQIVEISAGETLDITLQFEQADASISGSAKLEGGDNIDFGFCHAWSEEGRFSGGEIFGGSYNIPLVEGNWHIGCDTKTVNGFFRSEEVVKTVVTGDELTQDFVLEEADFIVPESFSTTFDSSQPKIITLSDGTTLNIPSGALASEGDVTVSADPNINLYHTATTRPLSFAWDFIATDSSDSEITEFNSNITITIPYDAEYVAAQGLSVEDLTAKYFDETNNTWQSTAGITIDTENNLIIVNTDHFTNYAVVTATSGAVSQAAPGTLGVIVTPQSSGGPNVRVLDMNGEQTTSFFAYQSGLRGEFVAVQADLDGDNTNEIITVPGAGLGPNVRAFDSEGTLLDWFMAYDTSFRGGLNIIPADLDGDGDYEIVIAPMSMGGPNVRAYDYINGEFELIDWFMAYDSAFHGGVNLATGDLNGDGSYEVITVPRSHGSSNIRAYALTDGEFELFDWFMAYDSAFHYGVELTTGDFDGDGTDEIVAVPLEHGGPNVRMYSLVGEELELIDWTMAYDTAFHYGANLTAMDLDEDTLDELVIAPNVGGAPNVRIYELVDDNLTLYDWFWGYAQGFKGGINL